MVPCWDEKKTPSAACAGGRGKNKAAHRMTLIVNLVFPLLVLLLIWLGLFAEPLDSRKNRLTTWEAPSLVDNIYEMDYYKRYKCVFEREINTISIEESENMQRSWGSRIKRKTKGAVCVIRIFKHKAINYNEMIWLKITSLYKITSVGLNGRKKWGKNEKYKKSNCGCKNADRKKKEEQVKRRARDTGRSSKSTWRNAGEKCKWSKPSQNGEQVPTGELTLGVDSVRDALAGLNGSIAYHRWKQKRRMWVQLQ